MSKLKIKISSTALGFSACILNFTRVVVDGYKGPSKSSAVYGVALHKFTDTLYKTNNPKAAVEALNKAFNIIKIDDPKKPWLSDNKHCIVSAFNLLAWIEQESTFEIYQLNNKPATEVTFSILYYEDNEFEVYLEGTIDKIGQFVAGVPAIGDWKTTSSWDNVGYFKVYELSRQLRFYTLACKLIYEKEPDSIIGKIAKGRMGAFIDAIFIKENPNDNTIKRSTVYSYDDKDLTDFRGTLDTFIAKLTGALRSGYIPKEGILNGSCEGKWGMCQFWNVCKSNEAVGKMLLERDFKKIEWNPLNYHEYD